jgi:uncharacterized membrane protein YgcG
MEQLIMVIVVEIVVVIVVVLVIVIVIVIVRVRVVVTVQLLVLSHPVQSAVAAAIVAMERKSERTIVRTSLKRTYFFSVHHFPSFSRTVLSFLCHTRLTCIFIFLIFSSYFSLLRLIFYLHTSPIFFFSIRVALLGTKTQIPRHVRVLTSIDEMVVGGIITDKRPNPRNRKKLTKQRGSLYTAAAYSSSSLSSSSSSLSSSSLSSSSLSSSSSSSSSGILSTQSLKEVVAAGVRKVFEESADRPLKKKRY